MKIRKESAANVILFEDVPGGTVFKDEEENICMKLESCYMMSASGIRYNAIILEAGCLIYFNDPNEEVEVLKNAVLTY